MKVFSFRVKKQGFFKRAGVNLVIFSMLLTVFAFSYAGGTMQVFNTQNGAEAIYYGNRSSNNISLMINVYWGDEFLDGILKTLDEHDAKVTFFVGGVWASKNEEMLKRFVQEGHELANHGYNHKDQNRISQQENYNEINQTHQIVKSFTGLDPQAQVSVGRQVESGLRQSHPGGGMGNRQGIGIPCQPIHPRYRYVGYLAPDW